MTEVNDLLALDTVVAVGHEEVDIYNYGLTYINGAVSYIGRNACEASGGHVIALVLDVEIHKTGLNIGDLLSLVLMLGTADTTRDSNLRTTAEADAQGKNRYERGKFFFNWCQTDAEAHGLKFNWKKVEVEGVAHSQAKMAPAAADYLYGN